MKGKRPGQLHGAVFHMILEDSVKAGAGRQQQPSPTGNTGGTLLLYLMQPEVQARQMLILQPFALQISAAAYGDLFLSQVLKTHSSKS